MKIIIVLFLSLMVFRVYPQDNPLDLNEVTSEELNSNDKEPVPLDNENGSLETNDQKIQEVDPGYNNEPMLIEED